MFEILQIHHACLILLVLVPVTHNHNKKVDTQNRSYRLPTKKPNPIITYILYFSQ